MNKRFIISRSILLLAGILLLLVWYLSRPSELVAPVDRSLTATQDVSFPSSNIGFNVEIAHTPEERSRGLMYRTHLDHDKGMLFIYQSDTRSGFWMKNTLIPLDMIFISANREVVDIIRNAQPCKKEKECDIHTPNSFYRYVLEINGGLADQYSINVGDQVHFE